MKGFLWFNQSTGSLAPFPSIYCDYRVSKRIAIVVLSLFIGACAGS